jgi:hypothetical protein
MPRKIDLAVVGMSTSSKWDSPSAVARHFIANSEAEASKIIGIRALS